MTLFDESVPAPNSESQAAPRVPKLFGEAEAVAVGGHGGGVEGVGEADDRDTGARPTHGGAIPGGEAADDGLDGLLDRDLAGVRGAAPATRNELAELILRYREEQATQRARRRQVETKKPRFTSEQRLLILDSWLRSKLPAGDFAPLVGISLHTLRAWKARFEEHGPAGLDDQPLGRPAGSRLSEATKRSILLMKEQHPDLGPGPDRGGAAAVAGLLGECDGDRPRVGRGWLRGGAGAVEAARSRAATLRACAAQSAVADGPFHLHVEA